MVFVLKLDGVYQFEKFKTSVNKSYWYFSLLEMFLIIVTYN